MKKLALILMAAAVCVACNKTAEKQQTTQIEEVVVVEETVVDEADYIATEALEEALPVAEQMPEFPGGMGELMKYLGENIQYPTKAQDNHWEGVAVCQFVVEKDGRVGEVKVVRGKHPDLDKEAVRVVKSIKTRFVPGKNNGQPVRQWFTLPINFKLQQ